jgi:ATP-dependent Lon protease
MSDPERSPDFDSGGVTEVDLANVPGELAILPLRDTILFPHAILPLAVARESSVALVNDAVKERKVIGVVTQRDPAVDDPVDSDLYRVGTLTHIHKMFKFPDGSLRLVVQGVQRFRLVQVHQYRPFLKASIEMLPEPATPEQNVEVRALAQSAQGLFQRVVELSPTLSDELQTLAANIQEPARLADFIAGSLPSLTTAQKQELLETLDVRSRLDRLNKVLVKDLEVLEVGNKIQSQVKTELQKNQREYYLREQMKAIQKELGEGDDQQREYHELREKIEKAGMPEEAQKEALRELDRLSKMSPAAAEYTVARTYLDWLVALPWSKRTDAEIDIIKAKEVLDNDHYDLEKVKERILEYLAVRKMKPDIKGPILCFVGPPGVGKTSLGRSIAGSMGRKFHRISLGGMRDEAEIRGHRRTYIGRLARPDHPGPAAAPRARTRSSCWTRWTRSGPTSAATPPRRCSRCWTPSRTTPSRTTTSTCRSTCPRSCSSPRPTSWTPSRPRCATAWRSSAWPATSRRRSSTSPAAPHPAAAREPRDEGHRTSRSTTRP